MYFHFCIWSPSREREEEIIAERQCYRIELCLSVETTTELTNWEILSDISCVSCSIRSYVFVLACECACLLFEHYVPVQPLILFLPSPQSLIRMIAEICDATKSAAHGSYSAVCCNERNRNNDENDAEELAETLVWHEQTLLLVLVF